MTEVTKILAAMESGDKAAAEELLPLVYNELRALARARVASEPAGQTIQATELVHEAYLRLVGSPTSASWNSRGHFFGAAARAMRRILIDRARMRQATKRGGDMEHIELRTDILSTAQRDDRLLQLDAALATFEDEDPAKARLVELRFFAGLSIPDVAEHLGISVATANRHWAYARAWLKREMDR